MAISRLDRRRALLAAVGWCLVGAAPVAAAPTLPLADIGAMLATQTDTPSDVVISPETPDTAPLYEAVGQGEASYYGRELAGNRTASGERFNPADFTCAHRTLPLGSRLRVTNKANGKSVIVRVNDRGPFAHHRIIDVSLAAAKQIAMVGPGEADVTLELLR